MSEVLKSALVGTVTLALVFAVLYGIVFLAGTLGGWFLVLFFGSPAAIAFGFVVRELWETRL